MKALKIVLIVIAAVILFVAAFLGVLTVTEFLPKDVQDADVLSNDRNAEVELGKVYTALTFNIGYAGLGKESDFFMDGGKSVRMSKEITEKNFEGIQGVLGSVSPDFCLLQEVDISSKRTYNINEAEELTTLLKINAAHALNYSCPYVPFPLPTIGKVNSGIMTLSDANFTSAERVSLPIPFKWPVRIANLKRCLLVERFPIAGSDKELVVINLHMEAYDDGDGKIAQTQQLVNLMTEEFGKGNYVIAGGDFNQSFPGTLEKYPIVSQDYYVPGQLDWDLIPKDFLMVYDQEEPSCRLLNMPYEGADMKDVQYYIIDGFICSPNVSVSTANVVNLDFEFSDHNPVEMKFTLN